MLQDNARGFGLITIVLHWACALAIFFLFGLGIYMTGLSYYEPWYHKGPTLHVSVGLCLLLAMLARLIWRLVSRSPDPLPSHSPLVRFAASAVKIFLYALIFTVLATGYLITSAEGKSPAMFGLLEFPVLLQLNADNVDLAGWIHEIFAWAIMIVAGVHALAALAHHFIFKDRTLVRMLKPVHKTDL